MYLGNIVEKIDGNKLTEAKHPYTKALLKAVFSLDNEQNKNIELFLVISQALWTCQKVVHFKIAVNTAKIFVNRKSQIKRE